MFLFPKWTNKVTPYLLMGFVGSLIFVVFVFAYYFSPKRMDVGYAPEQPIKYSHALHVGQLGIDCRYCHQGVETGSKANLPPTETCMNCHNVVREGTREGSKEEIAKLVQFYEAGKSIPWVKVSFVPDYTYFDHSAHIRAGVSCVTCHGRVDQMEVVHQSKPLSMNWCIECHRSPERHLRPSEHITKMDWSASNAFEIGRHIRESKNLQPKQDCSTCHR